MLGWIQIFTSRVNETFHSPQLLQPTQSFESNIMPLSGKTAFSLMLLRLGRK